MQIINSWPVGFIFSNRNLFILSFFFSKLSLLNVNTKNFEQIDFLDDLKISSFILEKLPLMLILDALIPKGNTNSGTVKL